MNIDTVNDGMYRLRAFALYSVVLAHSCYPSTINTLDKYVFSRISCIGVAIFFLQSGYYLKDETPRVVLLKLRKKILIPWFFCGTLMFFVSFIKKGSIENLKAYVNYMIGNGSYLYYCTVYFLMRLLLSLFPLSHKKTKKCLAIIFIVGSVISLQMTSFGLLPNYVLPEKWFFEYINPYLNILNWVGYIGVGVLTKEYDIPEKIRCIKPSVKVLLAVLGVSLTFVGIIDNSYGYFGSLCFICEICIICVSMLLVFSMPSLNKKYVIHISKSSFVIYLLHYPVLSLLCHGEILRESYLVAIIRPVICIILLHCVLNLLRIAARKTGIERVYYALTGQIPD